MSQTAGRARRTIAALGLLALFALAADCFKPSVESGGLRCAAGPKACPDGFVCAGTLCVSDSAPIGTGGIPGSGGQLATATGGQPGTGGVPGTGGGGTDVRAVGQTCTIANRGQPNQSDDCEPGAVCAGNCPQPVCSRVCASDDDCPGSSCTGMTSSGTRICEVTYTTCDPQDGQQGCSAPRSCYLLSSAQAPGGGDETVCDCSVGEGGVGAPCSDSRQCFAGLVCPPASSANPGGGACRQVCDPSNLAATGCPLLGVCHAFGGKWGYCY
jgi:hypothetical protein